MVITPWPQRTVGAFLWLGTGLLFVAVAVAAAPAGADAAIIIMGISATTAVVIRAARIEIQTSEQGVLIRNMWRTRFIAWSDLDQIKVDTYVAVWMWGPAKTVFFRSRGRWSPAQAAMRWRGAEQVTEALRREAERHGAPLSSP